MSPDFLDHLTTAISERKSSHQLHVPRLRYRPVPLAEAGGRWIVIERYAIAERLTVAREVVIVEYVECFRAELEGEALFNDEFL